MAFGVRAIALPYPTSSGTNEAVIEKNDGAASERDDGECKCVVMAGTEEESGGCSKVRGVNAVMTTQAGRCLLRMRTALTHFHCVAIDVVVVMNLFSRTQRKQ